MNESTYLIPLETALDNPVELYTKDALDTILLRIREATATQVIDATTPEGRAEIKSLAYKIARSKTAIDDAGKTLVADLKTQSGKIDVLRKHARDTLDALKDEVRAPVTAWEAEQARIEREERERIERERQEQEAARQAEVEELRRQNDELVARERASREAAEKVERERKIAESAALAERQRAEAEAARKKREDEARARDVEHRRKVNIDARDALMDSLPCGQEMAERIVSLIAGNKVPNITINY